MLDTNTSGPSTNPPPGGRAGSLPDDPLAAARILLVRVVGLVIFCTLIIALLAILVPVGIFVVIVAAIIILAAIVRTWFRRARQPNGVFDGRRNVRVVQRDPDRDSAP